VLVRHLSLTDFRNYESAEVELGPGPTLFVGSNGQGKTNLVESLGFLSTVGSHRVPTDKALIRAGAESAIIRARLEHADRSLLVEAQLNKSSPNRAQVNRSVIKTRELPRYFSSVLFAPEDLALVRGEPSGRRRFLDELLVLLSPRMSGVLSDYDRVLRQRNTLLKSARTSGLGASQLGTLDIWDERLTALGSEIIRARARLVEELSPHVAEAYRTIAGAEHTASIAPVLSVFGADPENDRVEHPTTETLDNLESAFRDALAGKRRAELDRGVTLLGPHRDDLLLVLNTLPARGYASHGESWSFALALKLASAHVLRRDSSVGDPVLILDDVFAELDENRRARLSAAVRDFEQVLITAAVRDDVPDELAATAISIRRGRVIEPGDEASDGVG
jgi:DNA replication and repair protein RecF